MPFAPSVENTAGFTKYMARASTVLSAIHVRLIHAQASGSTATGVTWALPLPLNGRDDRQRPQEVAQVVGECVELEADSLGGEGAAR